MAVNNISFKSVIPTRVFVKKQGEDLYAPSVDTDIQKKGIRTFQDQLNCSSKIRDIDAIKYFSSVVKDYFYTGQRPNSPVRNYVSDAGSFFTYMFTGEAAARLGQKGKNIGKNIGSEDANDCRTPSQIYSDELKAILSDSKQYLRESINPETKQYEGSRQCLNIFVDEYEEKGKSKVKYKGINFTTY